MKKIFCFILILTVIICTSCGSGEIPPVVEATPPITIVPDLEYNHDDLTAPTDKTEKEDNSSNSSGNSGGVAPPIVPEKDLFFTPYYFHLNPTRGIFFTKAVDFDYVNFSVSRDGKSFEPLYETWKEDDGTLLSEENFSISAFNVSTKWDFNETKYSFVDLSKYTDGAYIKIEVFGGEYGGYEEVQRLDKGVQWHGIEEKPSVPNPAMWSIISMDLATFNNIVVPNGSTVDYVKGKLPTLVSVVISNGEVEQTVQLEYSKETISLFHDHDPKFQSGKHYIYIEIMADAFKKNSIYPYIGNVNYTATIAVE